MESSASTCVSVAVSGGALGAYASVGRMLHTAKLGTPSSNAAFFSCNRNATSSSNGTSSEHKLTTACNSEEGVIVSITHKRHHSEN